MSSTIFKYISRGHGVGIFTMAQGMGVYPENYHLRDTPACRGKPRRLYNNTFICSYCLQISSYMRQYTYIGWPSEMPYAFLSKESLTIQ